MAAAMPFCSLALMMLGVLSSFCTAIHSAAVSDDDLLMLESSRRQQAIPASDADLLEFPLNLEYLEAEFFLWGSLGFGLDKFAPNLTMGGPSPVDARVARLDPFTRDVIYQFALQEIGHLRAIKSTVKGFPRPLLNLSAAHFAGVMNDAFGRPLEPPFDPYASGLNFLLASYLIPYVGLTGYVGANPKLQSPTSKHLVAGLLAVESGQDAVIRALLYRRAAVMVAPYRITVAEFTSRISELRNQLGKSGLKDEGLVVRQVRGRREGVGEMFSQETNSPSDTPGRLRKYSGLFMPPATSASPAVSTPTVPKGE